LIVINRTPTPVDHLADVHIQAEAGPTLSAIVAILDGTPDRDGAQANGADQMR